MTTDARTEGQPEAPMADRDGEKVAPTTLLDASAAFCHELSERLTAAGNYLAGLRKLANPGFRSASAESLEIFDKALHQLDLTGQLVHRYRRLLTAEIEAEQSKRAHTPSLLVERAEAEPPECRPLDALQSDDDGRARRR